MAHALPNEARVVIIGGGAIGCSTAYHLAAAGCTDVVLLERNKVTSGTTWHSAAQVRQLRSSHNQTRMVRYSAELYQSLEAETGQATGWTPSGSLLIATNPERLTHLRRQAAAARGYGIEANEIDGADIERLWPLMRRDDVIAGIHMPGDGRVNPSDLCQAYLKGARAKGVQLFEDTPVTGFETSDGRVTGVRTDAGLIKCRAVVLAAGLWSRSVGLMAGVNIPVQACEHFYLLTKPIPGINGHLPTLGDHDGYLYIRDDVGGLLVGCFEPMGKAVRLDDLPKDFSFDLLNEDWDHFEPMMRNAIHRIPALETAEVRLLLNGPESFTPDGAPLLGEAVELGGFFVGCGMNSFGVAISGGFGKVLAHWVLNGRAPFDLWPFDVSRVNPVYNRLDKLEERAPEVLGTHYLTSVPGREHSRARNLIETPVHGSLAARGAVFGERAGWERPLFYRQPGDPEQFALGYGKPAWHENVKREHLAARDAAALFDQSSFTKLAIAGPDALAFLQRLCANQIDVPPGRVIYTPILNEQGTYESDVTVVRLEEDSFLLITGTAQYRCDQRIVARNRKPSEVLSIDDVTHDYGVLAINGPRSRDILRKVCESSLANEDFPYLHHRRIRLAGTDVDALRMSYVGELGWELYIPKDRAADVYRQIHEAGKEFGLSDAGIYALSSLRVEKGIRAWGSELTVDYTPFDAGLGFTVAADKDVPFIGHRAIRRHKAEKIRTYHLLTFSSDEPDVFYQGGEIIYFDGQAVGQVTTAAYGHKLGRPLAMGYIRAPREVRDMVGGGGFEIDYAGRMTAVAASLKPLYDPESRRPRELDRQEGSLP